MARIRTIKPEFWTDSFVVSIPHLARLLYIALWNIADDHGYIRDEVESIAMQVLPREHISDVDAMLQLLIAAGRIEVMVSIDGYVYLHVAKWTDHQRVDHPAKSKIHLEGSRKLAIPFETRVKVAEKYGCEPGETVEASCFYCGSIGRIYWSKTSQGKPSRWVHFSELELDHVESENSGGSGEPENIVLACRSCNRSKGTNHWFDALCKKNIDFVASPLEASCLERKGKERNREQGKEQGIEAGQNDVVPLKRSRPTPKKETLSDEDWIQSLIANPAYSHIDVPAEFGKMSAWCQIKNKQPTRSRFLNWLNRIEKPIRGVSAQSSQPKTFGQIQLENIKNAMKGAMNDEAGLAGIQFIDG